MRLLTESIDVPTIQYRYHVVKVSFLFVGQQKLRQRARHKALYGLRGFYCFPWHSTSEDLTNDPGMSVLQPGFWDSRCNQCDDYANS